VIKAIIGKPGAGKSYVSMSIIEEELRLTKRVIITNVDVKIGPFADYLLKKYGDTFDLGMRMRKIADVDLRRFWELREDAKDESGKKIGGCCFVLDEVHRHFNARLWAENGKDKGKSCLDYLSAHRHYGDDVYYMTQNTHFLDKNFIRTTQDFTQLRNYSKERWGWFRGIGRFRGQVFLMPPDSANVHPIYTYGFKLDMDGLANCYNTDALDSNPGQGPADKGQRAKGLPVWCFPVGVVAAGVVCFFVLKRGITGVQGSIGPKLPAGETAPSSVVYAKTNAVYVKPMTNIIEASVGAPNIRDRGFATGFQTNVPVRMTGLSIVGGRFVAYLSDGRKIRQGDSRVRLIGDDFIEYDGVRYEMR